MLECMRKRVKLMIEMYFNKKDYEKITLDNICDYCKAYEDECGEYRECCYRDLEKVKKDG